VIPSVYKMLTVYVRLVFRFEVLFRLVLFFIVNFVVSKYLFFIFQGTLYQGQCEAW